MCALIHKLNGANMNASGLGDQNKWVVLIRSTRFHDFVCHIVYGIYILYYGTMDMKHCFIL